jgi:hypothetical protein
VAVAMFNQKLWQVAGAVKVRVAQLFLLIVALWFLFWAHIYELVVWNKTFVETLQQSVLQVLLYSMAILGIILFEVYLKRSRRVSTQVPISHSTKPLRAPSNKTSKTERKESTKTPAYIIGMFFFIVGVLLLIVSYVFASSTLALIGLSLTFWGVLFFFVRSTKFVKNDVLDASILPSYKSLDRILADLKYNGKALYIPPYPKDAYLPEHLGGMKEQIVFISDKDSTITPSIEEMAQKQFLVKNPEGICIIPPGSGLVNVFEKELGIDFTKIDRESFDDYLSAAIVSNLELATAFKIEQEDERVHVTITNSVYRNLYSKDQNLKSVQLVGCPLVSAISCALAMATGKCVTIAENRFSLDLKTIELWYQLVGGRN